jgi:hypothetical protein
MFKSFVLALLLVGGVAMAADFNRPEVQVGDAWKIKVGDSFKEVVVTGVNDSKIDILYGGYRHVLTNEWNPVSNTAEMKGAAGQSFTQYSPYIPYFRFPLVAGNKWKNDEVMFYRGSASGKLKVATEGVGVEEVVLSIGKFSAMKVVVNFDNGYDRGPVTCWYVPELKRPGKCVSRFGPVQTYEVVETNVWPPMKSASAGE